MRRLTASVLALGLAGCQADIPVRHRIVGGDVERGRAAVVAYGCISCHRIPEVTGLRGVVGPPLEDFGRRSYIAGVFPNEPMYLVSWLKDPPAMRPDTAMPDMNVRDEDARDMAAFLYTLR